MKTLFVGQNSIHVESLDSTNSYASEMLRQIELPEGSMIYTFEQLNGRGQRGNSWESEPNKNVTLSLVLYPRFLSPEKQFLLTRITSLAVADVMAEMLEDPVKRGSVRIKWPNDIYVNDKKIAGILIENTLRENSIQSAVAGIGINVNQRIFHSENAISLALLADHEFRLMDVMEKVCGSIEGYYLQLRSGKEESISEAYLKRLYRKNEWSSFVTEGMHFKGKITGVSAAGKLQVEMENNGTREFGLREISFI